MTKVAKYAAELAKREDIEYSATYTDQWTATVAGLLGDNIAPDITDNLLVALARAGKLTPTEMGASHATSSVTEARRLMPGVNMRRLCDAYPSFHKWRSQAWVGCGISRYHNACGV